MAELIKEVEKSRLLDIRKSASRDFIDMYVIESGADDKGVPFKDWIPKEFPVLLVYGTIRDSYHGYVQIVTAVYKSDFDK